MKLKLLGLLLVAALGASAASTFTVTGSGSTFRVTRSGEGTNAAETVLYRTVPVTAFPGQHYTAKSGTLVFAAGQTSTNIVVSESSPSLDAYKYRTGVSSRAYLFELTDRAGALLGVRERLVSSGLASVPSSGAFDVKDLVITNGTITVTDGGYAQAYHSVPVSSYYSAAAPKNYLVAAGAKLRMTVTFDARESDDGYQYVQIYANTPADDDHTDTGAKNGDPGDYNYARYAAGFTIDGNVDTTYYPYTFPLTSVGHACGEKTHPWSGNSNGNLEQQYFQSNCRATDGRLIVPTDLSSLYIRLNASGNFGDTWYAKNVKAHIQAVDSTKPAKLADPVVAPGRYGYGNTFYVSIPFSEIVTVSGTPTLTTDWGTLTYYSGSGSNVLTFKGTVDADLGENLVVRTLSGTIKDLAGNAFSTAANNVYKSFSCTVDYPWAGAGTEADPYVITTTNQLDYLAARVNASISGAFEGDYFELGADIAYASTGDWDDTGTFESNFTPIGCYGKAFKGHFDGKGHTVSGIRVHTDSTSTTHDNENLGLFGYVSGGTVQNVVLRDANICGLTSIGGIVGFLIDGTIADCTLHHVRVATWQSSDANTDIVAGYGGGTVDGTHYRDCCKSVRGNSVSPVGVGVGAFVNDPRSDIFSLDPAADVAAAFVSGESAAIDGTNYCTAGSAFALSYTGAAAVPVNWSVVYAATGGAAVNGATLTLASADATVSAAFAPPADYAAHWQAGADHDGATAERAYVITTPEGLQLLSAEVNAGTGFAGTYFQLGADIDMGAVDSFDPIGRYNSKPFAGNFDGAGHTIRNLTVNITDSTRAGLFGRVDGSVSDLALIDATITGEYSVGGIVGALYASGATLDNCHVVRSVIASNDTDLNPDIGAIVGLIANGTAVGCTYHSTVVRAPNATDGDFHADGGDTFNIGTGRYLSFGSGCGDTFGAALDPSCLLLPTNVPAFRAALIAAYADPAAHTAHGGAAPDLSGLVVTSGVTRLYAVTNAAPAGLSVSGTDVVLAGLGRSYFAPGDAVALVPPAGSAIVSASYDDGAAHVIPYADGAFSFAMPAGDVSVAATLAPASGYCGRADANGGENVVWSFDPATGALAVSTNAAAVGTDFSMADYEWNVLDAIPWAALWPFITSLTIAPGVASVGDNAFRDCAALASVSIGGDVSGIGESAFQNCTALEAVSLPGSVASIGRYAFFGCTALVTVEGGANVTRVDGYAFGSLGGWDDYTTPWLRSRPAGVVYLGKVAIAFRSGGGTAVEIAPGTVSIAPCAFNPSPVTSVVIPESVVYIGGQAFGNCDNLAAVYLPSAAPPAFDDPDRLFARESGRPNSDLLFYVRGTAYADAWSGVWDWMADNSDWTDANRIVIGTVSCADGITAAGTPAVTYGGTNYYAADTAIALSGEPPAAAIPAGYVAPFVGYAVNGRPVDGASFAMPEGDVTVTPRWTVADFETDHDGTEQDPYVIYNKDQLDLLATRVNGGTNYRKQYFKLGADIAYDPTALDANGENYTAIGSYSRRFSGNFDGAGHTVSGIRINKTGNDDASNDQGLFGFCDGGTLQNITLADSVIVGKDYVGGIAGECINCVVLACRAESSVIIKAGCEGADNHGGIAGTMHRLMSGCFSAATVTDNGKANCSYYGGIVGDPWPGTVKDCLAIGSVVTSYSWGGAIAGYVYRATFTNNYYAACTVDGTTNATNVGCGSPAGDQDGVRYAHTITLGPGVRIVGEETVYSNSCLTAIGTSALVLRSLGEGGLSYTGGGTNVIYSGAGQTVALAYDGVPPEGYAFDGFAVNGVAIDGDSFAMPDADATVTARLLSPWAQLQAALDAAAGGTVVLDRDYAAGEGDATLTVTNAVTLDLNGHTIDAKGRFGVITIASDGDLTLTNSVPESGLPSVALAKEGAITGGNSSSGGGVTIYGGTFTMAGGTISGNSAQLGGGVAIGSGTFTLAGGEISGNAAELFGGGVFLASGSLEVSGSPVVAGNTNSFGAPVNVFLYGGMITAGDLAAGAAIGVSSYTPPIFGGTTIATGATADDAAYFFSDSPNYHVEFANDELRLVGGTVYPVYLAGADDVVTNNWFDWARKYGANTNAEYEAAFLLDIDPATPIPAGAAMLKVVDFQVTENGYRFELASDVCDLYHPDGDKSLLCNGYAAVKIAADLGEFSRNAGSTQNAKGGAKIMTDPIVVDVEKITLPGPVTIDATTGHAVIDLDISIYEWRKNMPRITLPPPPLFFRVLLTPIKPDYVTEVLSYR